jgi:hypothetical protein
MGISLKLPSLTQPCCQHGVSKLLRIAAASHDIADAEVRVADESGRARQVR